MARPWFLKAVPSRQVRTRLSDDCIHAMRVGSGTFDELASKFANATSDASLFVLHPSMRTAASVAFALCMLMAALHVSSAAVIGIDAGSQFFKVCVPTARARCALLGAHRVGR